ncbi:MAG: SPFH domain-containing protein [Halioglobus sp.]
MNIFEEIKEKLINEFIDIVEWLDPTEDTIVHRFERYQNEIKNEAQLIVREGQAAVFVSEGQLADVFQPGTYTLNTQNLPILTTIKGWKYGFNSPFKAEVYFVNTHLFTDEKWGTKNPITLSDDRFGLVEIRAFGTYAFRVTDPALFIKDVVGTDGNFTTFEINEHLKSLIATRFTDTVGEANIPIEMYASNSDELSEACRAGMNPEFNSVGITLEKFFVENVSMPEELKKEIFEYSRLEKIDLAKLSQFKAAKAIEEAAKNQGGTAGAGMGMGMGFALANQMSGYFQPPQQQAQPNQLQQHAGVAPAAVNSVAPPPLPPVAQYFYALDGVQQGPLELPELSGLFARRTITKDTLVWKQGMAQWQAFQEVDELKQFLGGAMPPPLPTS